MKYFTGFQTKSAPEVLVWTEPVTQGFLSFDLIVVGSLPCSNYLGFLSFFFSVW